MGVHEIMVLKYIMASVVLVALILAALAVSTVRETLGAAYQRELALTAERDVCYAANPAAE